METVKCRVALVIKGQKPDYFFPGAIIELMSLLTVANNSDLINKDLYYRIHYLDPWRLYRQEKDE